MKTAKAPPENSLLTLSETASRLRICDRNLRNKVKAKQIPFIRLGKRLLFDWDVVRARLSQ